MRLTRRCASFLLGAVMFGATSGVLGAQWLPTERADQLGFSENGLRRVGSVVQAHIDSGVIAGAVLVIARHGKIAYRNTYGVMDLGTRQPMRADALFRICSMSKPVTAAAAMQLVDRGKLDLKDPVAKYLPAFAQAKVYSGGSSARPNLRDPDRPILVEDLMLHTPGFTYGPWGTSPVDTLWTQAHLFDWDQPVAVLADKVARLPLVFSPGTQWNYGVSLDVLGRVIEVVSGKPLDVYLRDELFAPLGMRETGFVVKEAALSRFPTLYDRADSSSSLRPAGPHIGECGNQRLNGRLFGGGGGLVSTVADYLRFAQMLLNNGELDGHRVLSSSSVRQMMTNHLPPTLLPLPLPTMLGRPGQPGYGQGYGGAVLLDPSANPVPGSVGIYRWLGYYSTYFWIDPKEDVITMVWTQYLPSATTSIGLDPAVQRAVYAALSPP